MESILKTGTTTIGLVCKDGIVLAADKRITVGGGMNVGNAKKVIKINDRLAITIAGTASDAFMLARYLRSELKLKELHTKSEVTVQEAANLLARFVYSNIRSPSVIPGVTHFLIAGRDAQGVHLYDIFPDGSISKVDTYYCSGSGSVYAYGLIDSEYSPDMNVEEGISLAKKAISSAITRDTASGNGYDILVITPDAVKEVESVVFNNPLKD